MLVANKIALGQIDAGDRGRRGHHLRRADRASTRTCARCCWRPTARSPRPDACAALAELRPEQIVPAHPAQRGAAHRPVDGRAPGAHRRGVGRRRARSRTSWPLAATSNLAAAYERGFNDDLVTPYLGLERDQNLRADTSPEKLAKLKPVFGGERAR